MSERDLERFMVDDEDAVFSGPVTQNELIITWLKRRNKKIEREKREREKKERELRKALQNKCKTSEDKYPTSKDESPEKDSSVGKPSTSSAKLSPNIVRPAFHLGKYLSPIIEKEPVGIQQNASYSSPADEASESFAMDEDNSGPASSAPLKTSFETSMKSIGALVKSVSSSFVSVTDGQSDNLQNSTKEQPSFNKSSSGVGSTLMLPGCSSAEFGEEDVAQPVELEIFDEIEPDIQELNDEKIGSPLQSSFSEIPATNSSPQPAISVCNQEKADLSMTPQMIESLPVPECESNDDCIGSAFIPVSSEMPPSNAVAGVEREQSESVPEPPSANDAAETSPPAQEKNDLDCEVSDGSVESELIPAVAEISSKENATQISLLTTQELPDNECGSSEDSGSSAFMPASSETLAPNLGHESSNDIASESLMRKDDAETEAPIIQDQDDLDFEMSDSSMESEFMPAYVETPSPISVLDFELVCSNTGQPFATTIAETHASNDKPDDVVSSSMQTEISHRYTLKLPEGGYTSSDDSVSSEYMQASAEFPSPETVPKLACTASLSTVDTESLNTLALSDYMVSPFIHSSNELAEATKCEPHVIDCSSSDDSQDLSILASDEVYSPKSPPDEILPRCDNRSSSEPKSPEVQPDNVPPFINITDDNSAKNPACSSSLRFFPVDAEFNPNDGKIDSSVPKVKTPLDHKLKSSDETTAALKPILFSTPSSQGQVGAKIFPSSHQSTAAIRASNLLALLDVNLGSSCENLETPLKPIVSKIPAPKNPRSVSKSATKTHVNTEMNPLIKQDVGIGSSSKQVTHGNSVPTVQRLPVSSLRRPSSLKRNITKILSSNTVKPHHEEIINQAVDVIDNEEKEHDENVDPEGTKGFNSSFRGAGTLDSVEPKGECSAVKSSIRCHPSKIPKLNILRPAKLNVEASSLNKESKWPSRLNMKAISKPKPPPYVRPVDEK